MAGGREAAKARLFPVRRWGTRVRRRAVCAARSSAYTCDDLFTAAAHSKSYDASRRRPKVHVAPCASRYDDSVDPRQYAIRTSCQGVTADDSTHDARPLAKVP